MSGGVFVLDHQNLIHPVPVDVFHQHARAYGDIRLIGLIFGAIGAGLGEEFMDGRAVVFRTGVNLLATL